MKNPIYSDPKNSKPKASNEIGNSIDFIISLTGTNKQILQLGSVPSQVFEALKKNGCKLFCVEINSLHSHKDEPHSDSFIIDDGQIIDLNKKLGNEKFDIILIENFLEYLTKPEQFLEETKKFLKTDGYVICSLPNIGHITTRLRLLDGYFQANKFNNSHQRFFTLDSILNLFNSASFGLVELKRVKEDLDFSKNLDLKKFIIPKELIDSILQDPEATTIRYIFKALPNSIVNIQTIDWLNEFPKGMVTESLSNFFNYYKEYLAAHYEKQIKDLQKELENKNFEISNFKSQLDTEKKIVKLMKQKPPKWESLIILERVYRKILRRQPDQSGMDYFLSKLESKEYSEDDLIRILSESEEAQNLKKSQEN